MERKNLLIFTTSYPYGPGETFLETEMIYLNKVFSKIIIIPSLPIPPMRLVPDGITVNDSLAFRGEYSGLRKFFDGLAASLLNVRLIREIINEPRILVSSQSLYRTVNMQGGARWVNRITQNILDEYNLNANETLAYSYWLDFSTIGMTSPALRQSGLKTLSRGHGYDLYDYVHTPPYIPYKEASLKNLDLMVFISDHGRDYITSQYPFVSERCTVSRLGVTDPGFISNGSPAGNLNLISCSRMIPVKQLHLLVEGLALLGKSHPDIDVKWTHIGDGPEETMIRNMCRKMLPDHVKYEFTGHLSNRDVMAFYKNNEVDVFVNVSRSEGIPVTMMEAQSCGIPVCGRAVGGVPEIVNNDNGILLASGAGPDELADALYQFAGTTLRREKGIKSRTNWEQHYNAEMNYSAFTSLLKTL